MDSFYSSKIFFIVFKALSSALIVLKKGWKKVFDKQSVIIRAEVSYFFAQTFYHYTSRILIFFMRKKRWWCSFKSFQVINANTQFEFHLVDYYCLSMYRHYYWLVIISLLTLVTYQLKNRIILSLLNTQKERSRIGLWQK